MFAVVYAQIFSHHLHTTKATEAKVMPVIIKKVLEQLTCNLKSHILTVLVWGDQLFQG